MKYGDYYFSDLLKQSGAKLMQAVFNNNYEEVKNMIRDAKHFKIEEEMVNIRGKNGMTPLYQASFDGYLNIVSFLLDAKANIDQADYDGVTPLYVASQENKLEVVKELLQRGADVNKADNGGSTPAYIATQLCNKDVLKFLLSNGVKVDQKCFSNETILHKAAECNYHSIVEMLIKEFDIKNIINDSSNDYNQTPLTSAIRIDGDLQMVKLLVEAGADKKKVGHKNKTPLQWAEEKGKNDIVKYLRN